MSVVDHPKVRTISSDGEDSDVKNDSQVEILEAPISPNDRSSERRKDEMQTQVAWWVDRV